MTRSYLVIAVRSLYTSSEPLAIDRQSFPSHFASFEFGAVVAAVDALPDDTGALVVVLVTPVVGGFGGKGVEAGVLDDMVTLLLGLRLQVFLLQTK